MIKIKFILIFFLPFVYLSQRQISIDEAINLSLKNSPVLKVASYSTLQNSQLQKTAFNLSNPEIMMESPSGEFQTLGVIQSFSFPTVYIKQNQLLKEKTVLSKVGEKVSENDLRFQVKNLYLEIQFLDVMKQQYQIQDSIYNQIRIAVQRIYDAGQIDFLEKTFADAQYGEIHNQFLNIQSDLKVAHSQLQIYTGLREELKTNSLLKEPLVLVQLTNDTVQFQNNPSLIYLKQEQLISAKNISLEKNKFLPGFTFGYLNQASKNTPIDLRIRAGINIPLWFWQNTASLNAAKTGLKIAEQNFTLQQQVISIQLQKAQGDYLKFSQSLAYYETIGVKQADDIISSSKRFFEAGHDSDYINLLRTINEAYLIKKKYFESLKNYNQSILNINYLKGSL